jgi:hypothetical protein
MENKLDIRVAAIIEIDKIVINKGQKDGIEEYMRFLVYVEGEDIIDPISKKSLGVLENPKGSFKVIHLQENMTILISELKRPNSFLTLPQFLDVDVERDLLKTIKIGDKVKVIN